MVRKPSTVPTSTAAITVPTPTLPKLPMHSRHAARDMATSDESNSTFTLAKAMLLTSEMALMVPSPARAMMSGGM